MEEMENLEDIYTTLNVEEKIEKLIQLIELSLFNSETMQ